MKQFNYNRAISRNIGWLTEWEQEIIKTKTVAIAGLGGAGGFHLLTLIRLGVTKFKIADGDAFEIENFNRQAGANMTNLGTNKAEAMRKEALNINPDVKIDIYNFVTEENVTDFLNDVDIYVDGIDFFAVRARMLLFRTCEAKKIPIITVAPIGMGCTCLIYKPDGRMTLTEYFDLREADSDEKNTLKFLTGLSPKLYQKRYLQEQKRVDFNNKKGPSSITSCQLGAGIMVGEFIKLMLNRGKVYSVPYYHQYDAYLNKHKLGYLVFGNRNPAQVLKRYVIKRLTLKDKEKNVASSVNTANKPVTNKSVIHEILDMARWAPSGDNTQPWRFEIKNSNQVRINILSEKEFNLYDYAGVPTLFSIGCLLETIRIAASKYQLQMKWSYQQNDGQQFVDVTFSKGKLETDPRVSFITHRSVNRTPLHTAAIDAQSLEKLASCLDSDIKLKIYNKLTDRWQFAKINSLATKIRLSIPETYEIHKAILADHNYAKYGVPITCVGASPPTQKLMRWAIKSWQRIEFMNKYLAGTATPRLEMDIVPGLNCFGHFTFTKEDFDDKDHLAAIRIGMNIQRFWLTATMLGIAIQPALAPQMFAYYARNKINFSSHPSALTLATKLNEKLSEKVAPENLCFVGRLGWPKIHLTENRSGRLDLHDMLNHSDKIKATSDHLEKE